MTILSRNGIPAQLIYAHRVFIVKYMRNEITSKASMLHNVEPVEVDDEMSSSNVLIFLSQVSDQSTRLLQPFVDIAH